MPIIPIDNSFAENEQRVRQQLLNLEARERELERLRDTGNLRIPIPNANYQPQDNESLNSYLSPVYFSHSPRWAIQRQEEAVDFILSGTQLQTLVNPNNYMAKPQGADPVLLEKIYKATNKNVDIDSRHVQNGTKWEYSLYCSKCKNREMVSDPSVFKSHVNVIDKIIIYCINHRHESGNNAIKVLSCFADVVERPASIVNDKGGRRFREDDE